MNNQSPLVPQGSLLEQKNKGRTRVKIAVFFVLAVHGIGLLALLMQGCRNDDASTTAQTEPTNSVPTFDPGTNFMAEPAPPPVPVPTPTDPTPQAPTAAGEYTIVKGDNLTTIALNNKVTVRALQEANPGIEPTKLKIGQKIHIPAPMIAAPTAVAEAGAPPAGDNASGEDVYVVKSGDMLSKIASRHHTTVRAIRAANNLKTDSIKVGQKLKIPKPTTVASAAPAAPTAP
jgi:LysM repeat protein